MSVAAAVARDIVAIRKLDPVLADSGLAASALALGAAMDNPSSTTSLSMVAKALLETMDRLRELCPPEEKRDGIDDLASRRAVRLARLPGAEAQ